MDGLIIDSHLSYLQIQLARGDTIALSSRLARKLSVRLDCGRADGEQCIEGAEHYV